MRVFLLDQKNAFFMHVDDKNIRTIYSTSVIFLGIIVVASDGMEAIEFIPRGSKTEPITSPRASRAAGSLHAYFVRALLLQALEGLLLLVLGDAVFLKVCDLTRFVSRWFVLP